MLVTNVACGKPRRALRLPSLPNQWVKEVTVGGKGKFVTNAAVRP